MGIADPRRFHRPDRQSYAIDQARDRHTEALYRRGEYAMFVLMWTPRDKAAGRVGVCSQCVGRFDDNVQKAFGWQPSENKCEACFGTGFEGGFKAKIVRPSAWAIATSEEETTTARGAFPTQTASVQSTFDFSMDSGDFILRADGTRWFVRAPRVALLAEGHGALTDRDAALGFNYATATQVPHDSVAYLIDPDPDEIKTILRPAGHRMVDFSQYEIIRQGAVLV